MHPVLLIASLAAAGLLAGWPQRAIILVALAPFGFVVVLLPWLVAARHAALAAQDMRG